MNAHNVFTDVRVTKLLMDLNGLHVEDARLETLNSTLRQLFSDASQVDRTVEHEKHVGPPGFSPVLHARMGDSHAAH